MFQTNRNICFSFKAKHGDSSADLSQGLNAPCCRGFLLDVRHVFEARSIPGPSSVESRTTVTFLRNSFAIRHSSSYFFNELVVKNCTVTLRPIGNDRVLSSKPITASRTSRSLLSDVSPVEMLFLPIIADILTTDPWSLFPSRASAWITTFCPIDTLSTSLSSISALMCREEVSARLNNGRGVTVLKDSPRLA